MESNLEEYVKSREFDNECRAVHSRKPSEHVSASDYNDSYEEFNSDDGSSSSSPHEVSKVEAHLYYAGLGPKRLKLIYRTSDDKFLEPQGPEAYARSMKLCPVPEDHELGQQGLWDRIRDQVVELLDKRDM